MVLQGPGAKGSAKGQGSSESIWHREVLIDQMNSTKEVNRLRCHALHWKFLYIFVTVDEIRAQIKRAKIWELTQEWPILSWCLRRHHSLRIFNRLVDPCCSDFHPSKHVPTPHLWRPVQLILNDTEVQRLNACLGYLGKKKRLWNMAGWICRCRFSIVLNLKNNSGDHFFGLKDRFFNVMDRTKRKERCCSGFTGTVLFCRWCEAGGSTDNVSIAAALLIGADDVRASIIWKGEWLLPGGWRAMLQNFFWKTSNQMNFTLLESAYPHRMQAHSV